MANLNNPSSFSVTEPNLWKTKTIRVAASYAGKKGDVVYIDSAARATATPGLIYGIQCSGIRDVSNAGLPIDIGAVDDLIDIFYQPDVEFTGQNILGALTDPYTTRSGAACFDVAGLAGVQYVNSAASVNDTIKVVGAATEDKDGAPSDPGAFQKQILRFNPLVHVYGSAA